MTSFIDATFYEARSGETLDATKTAKVEAFIEDASELILDVAGLATDWTAGTVPHVVKGVTYHLVRRTVENPDGMKRESIEEYAYEKTDDAASTATMALTKDEYRIVRRAAGKSNVTTVGVRRPNAVERQFITDRQGEDLVL